MSSVDIVIPCYNYARFLPQSVESVLSQNGVEVRILIIDDCSTDETETVGRLLAAQDKRVEFRRHVTNKGHVATFNEGLLGWASSDYSLLLSADDALAPGALERASHLMDLHREVGMTCGMGRIIWDDEVYSTFTETSSAEYKIVSCSNFLERFFANGNGVCTPTAVVRTELQHQLGGYRADLLHSGDMEMWMRFAVHAPIGVLRSVQAYYRRHRENMSQQYVSQTLGDRSEVIQACEQIFVQWGERFPDSCYWREKMLERVSTESCWLASRGLDNGDLDVYKTCMEYAERLYPKIQSSRVWWKLRAKRAVGLGLWKKMLPAWEYIRRRRQRSSSPIYAQPTQLAGWWPDSPGE